MQTVYSGDIITFRQDFIDGLGDPYDPAEVTLRIAKNVTTFLSRPFTLSGGDIEQNVVGTYTYDYQTTSITTPGIYNARWDVNIEGDDVTFLESFQILERQPQSNSILDAPRVYGVMMESPLYRTLGMGETDRLFLIGHADGLPLNSPYQVNNMQEAVNLLGAHSESPLVRALLEAYNAGARDIWLVAAAPEGEYVPWDMNDPEVRFVERSEWGGQNFYERYFERLEVTYELLKEYDLPEIIVPVEAPFFETRGVDFLQQLLDHCQTAYELTSAPRVGIIGTRIGNYDAAKIQELINELPEDADFGAAGKFVMIVHGEATFRLPQMPTSHIAPVATVAAAQLSNAPMNSGLTYKLLKAVQVPYGRQLTKDEYRALSAHRINPLIRTGRGRRGTQYQSVLATDNTLATNGSDYWSIVQMRLVSKVIQRVRTLGNHSLGTIGFLQFKSDVNDYLRLLTMRNEIRDYSLLIERDARDIYKANVDVGLTPYFGVREIAFQVQVGPGV